MKKKLLCLVTCMSMILVACSGTKDSTKDKTAKGTTSDPSEYAKCVTLGDYKNLEFTKQKGVVEEKDMQDEINNILNQHTTTKEIKEGKVKDGDTVNIDYVGKVDGVAFDNGSAQGQSLKIGSNSYIDGFESGLIGAEVGKTVTINVTFPEDYGSEDLKGKAATFDVTINFIEGEKVVPKWTDKFVRSISEYKTTKEYEKQIKVELEQKLEQVEDSSLQSDILTKLVEISKFKKVPADLVKSRSDSMVKYYKDYAEQNKISYTDLLTQTFKMTEEEFEKQVNATSENSVKQMLVAFAVADKENLIPTGDKLKAKELEIAQQNGSSTAEEFAQMYGEDYALQLIVREAVINYIEENSKITEQEVSK